MAPLRTTIDRLVSEFASEILAAIGEVPFNELAPQAAPQAPKKAGRPPREPKKRAARKPREPKKPAAPPDASTIAAAQTFFTERGSRGATPPQMHEILKEAGLPGEADEVIGILVERGIVRDAGFRRTTGKGTAPVYVVVR